MYPKFVLPTDNDIQTLIDVCESSKLEIIDRLLDTAPTWDSFVEPYRDILNNRIAFNQIAHIGLLSSVGHYDSQDIDELQNLNEKITQLRFDFLSWIDQQQGICDALHYIQENDHNLSPIQKQWLELVIAGYEQFNIPLTDDENQQLINIQNELNTLKIIFESNHQESVETWKYVVTDRAVLSGIPDEMLLDYITGPSQWTLNATGICVNLVLTYCDNRILRQFMFEAINNLCSTHPIMKKLKGLTNHQNIVDILNLQHRQCKIMGYDTATEMILDGKMLDEVDKIQEFINRLVGAIADPVVKEELELYQIACDNGIFDVEPWDVRYLTYKACQFDSNALNQYFSLEYSLPKMLLYVGKLFEIEFISRETTIDITDNAKVHVWHPSIQCYEVYQHGVLIGALYFDFYCRVSKPSTSVWMESIRDRQPNLIPLATMVCNFEPDGRLTLDDVRTFMHELGHCLHHILNKCDYPEFSSNNTEWDIVEVPSMFLESYANNMQFLRSISSDCITGQPIPVTTIQTILSNLFYRKASDILFECRLIGIDLMLHNNKSEYDNFEEILSYVHYQNEMLPYDTHHYSYDICSFQHIFAGEYGSCYYSYLWAEHLVSKINKAIKYDSTFLKRLTTTIFESGSLRSFEDMWSELLPDDDLYNVDCLIEYYSIH